MKAAQLSFKVRERSIEMSAELSIMNGVEILGKVGVPEIVKLQGKYFECQLQYLSCKSKNELKSQLMCAK